MRIGLLAPPWIPVPPPRYGGTERIVGLLAEGLVRAGHDVVLVAHPESRVEGVELIPSPRIPSDVVIGQVSYELAHVLAAYEQLIAARPDVIHDHTTAGPVVASRARRAGIPVVTTIHGPFDERARVLLGDAASACEVVAISHAQAADAGPVPVAAVIHHGIDVERIRVGDGSGGYFAFLGRFTEGKGVTRAARLAHTAGVPLRIAAKMWEPAEVRFFHEQVEPLLGDGVEYVGEVGGAAKYEFLGAAVALLNPIDWPEPFGLAMIESMACGTPVIATGCGAAPELVAPGVSGWLARTDDDFLDALAAAPTLDRGVCRRHAERRFSAARMTADHLQLYGEVIEAAFAAGRERRHAALALIPTSGAAGSG